ncbi:MAG: molybdopterin-guanine dinucleotide biosynthesis protein B [Bacillota bacterium]
MRVFSVFGVTQSGKTTTIENIIRELKRRKYSVGSVKEIHFEEFAIDQHGSNTHRHRQAGADLVTARGHYETDILFPTKLSVEEILRFYDHDFVLLEGVTDSNVPKIITAHSEEEILERLDGTVFAISGRIAEHIEEFQRIPVLNSVNNIQGLVDLIEEKVYDKLPEFPRACCNACGYDCRELGVKILEGEATREDCVVHRGNVKLYINDMEIKMVPFVQKILQNAVMAVVQELEGYKKNAGIVIKIGE